MEEYIRLEEEKARRYGKVYNWETATYGKIWYDEDIHDLGFVKTEFLSIVFDDAFTSEVTPSCEPTPKRPRNAGWFKEKLMLAEAREAGQILDEEQLAFLADPKIEEALIAQQTIP
nr:hypothetical protein [Tanacetum cinerariifolium]